MLWLIWDVEMELLCEQVEWSAESLIEQELRRPPVTEEFREIID